MSVSQTDETLCPIAMVQRLLGERWTLQILNEIFIARGRFDEIEAQLGVTSIMLNARLRKLEVEGVILRQLYNPSYGRYEFVLTEKGRALITVMAAVRAYGEAWCKSDGQEEAVRFHHMGCGGPAGLGSTCDTCGELTDYHGLTVEILPAYAAERARRQEGFRQKRYTKHPLKRPPKT
ncbi:MAG: helix-turn-helix domain-containing protein [Alphaproteobacteria bacterium]